VRPHLTSPHLAKFPKLSQLTTGPQSQHRVLAESRVQSDQTEVKSSQLTECQFSSVHFLNQSPPNNQLVCAHSTTSVPSQANAIREVDML
jgi:hypothetical protein